MDLVIAVHDRRRDIARAVGSALTSIGLRRAIVVCHNTPVSGIAARLGALADDPRVLLTPLEDGIPSPAGPFNRGLELAESRYVSIMGSDDELDVGAIDEWLTAAQMCDAEVVIPAVRYFGGSRMPTPPTRPGRTGRLDPVRDRLAYRTAPLGLFSRARFGALRFTPGLASGEDLEFSTRLWFSGAGIARVSGGAHYVVHNDAERVTFTKRPVADDLAAVRRLIADAWVRALPGRSREAIAVKLWRIPVFGAVHYRAGGWSPEDRTALAHAADELRSFAPGAVDVLSWADRDLIGAIADTMVADGELDARSRARRRFLRPRALVPTVPTRLFAREAPLRFAAATWLAGRS